MTGARIGLLVAAGILLLLFPVAMASFSVLGEFLAGGLILLCGLGGLVCSLGAVEKNLHTPWYVWIFVGLSGIFSVLLVLFSILGMLMK
jgi:hypothetical protein